MPEVSSIQDTTVLIKTFERPDCLKAILASIREFYPDIQIIVADDSKAPYAPEIARAYKNIECVVLPFDVGISRGRNEMLKRVKTKYFVLCDDDLLFFENTKLERFRKILEETDAELVGGVFNDRGPTGAFDRPSTYAGRLVLDQSAGSLRLELIETDKDLIKCDTTHNFFMAYTEAIRQKPGGWDPQFKIIEHEDFFLRAKQKGLVVAFTPTVSVNHTGARSQAYNAYRKDRRAKYYYRLFKKWKIKSLGWNNGWPTITLHQVEPDWYKAVLRQKFIPWELLNKLRGKRQAAAE